MLTIPDNMVKLNREQVADLFCQNGLLVSGGKLTVTCSHAERSPFYLEEIMPIGVYSRTKKQLEQLKRVAYQKRHIPWIKGRHHSEEAKRKISETHKGLPSWNKGNKGFLAGAKHPRWSGGRRKDANGYIKILNPDHPFCDCKGYVFEHRLVMEKEIGKILKRTDLVHHLNGVKDDNRIENLLIVVRKNHYGKITCPYCKHEYLLH